MRRITAVHLLLLFSFGVVIAGDRTAKKGSYEEPLIDTTMPYRAPTERIPEPDWRFMKPLGGGTYTTLSGFYDYQSNGGSLDYIRVEPSTGNINVVYMTAPDSADPAHPARNVYFAYSSDGGSTWDNFSNAQIPGPPSRAGFPTMDLGQGTLDGFTLVANHNNSGNPTTTISVLYADQSGFGSFVELGSPPLLGASEPIWPYIAGVSDGSVVIASEPNVTTGPQVRYAVNSGFTNWTTWVGYPGVVSTSAGGRNPVAANGTGRVGIMFNNSNGSSGNYWLESTDFGVTWPTVVDTIYGLSRASGSDTLASYVHCDVIYDGDEPLFVMDEYNSEAGVPSDPRILFYSATSGYVTAVAFDSALFIADPLPQQRFHNFGVGWPVIGMSGSTIVVAFQAFQSETSPTAPNYNYSDIWFVSSADGGGTWSAPINLTNTPDRDERYPSISPWNSPGEANVVWQEDTEPGAHAFADGAPITRSSLVYMKVLLTDVNDDASVATNFRLDQNYPNPFNPSTKIRFRVPSNGQTELTVHTMLGQKIATLVDGYRNAGEYEVRFSGQGLTSGVYFYMLKSGEYVATKKMMLMK